MPEKKRQLLDLVRRASAMEQKWVVKMILKVTTRLDNGGNIDVVDEFVMALLVVVVVDLKLGFSHESFLKRFHPDAMELYNRSSMLRQVQLPNSYHWNTYKIDLSARGLGVWPFQELWVFRDIPTLLRGLWAFSEDEAT
eukprot:756021-Amphidinium_carterae.1